MSRKTENSRGKHRNRHENLQGIGVQFVRRSMPHQRPLMESWRNRHRRRFMRLLAACVFNCVVDNYIRVRRKRPNGKIEKFSTPRDVLRLLHKINSRKRCDRLKSIFPTAEDYLKRYS